MALTSKVPVLLIAMAIASLQALGLVIYSLTIGINFVAEGTSGVSGTDVSPWSLIGVFLAFAALIGLIIRGLWRGNGSARTPYLVTQAFGIVVGQTLVSGSETFEDIGGWALIAISIVGAIMIMHPTAARGLNIQR
jgi:hypothetical protein